MDHAGLDGELFRIASASVSIQKLIIVWYMEFSGSKRNFDHACMTDP